jgi:PadR family transcriptional regulator, regulatory protein PadR
MRRTYLGEFEEVVLLMVAILDGDGYGVTVSQALQEHTGRIVTFGSVHNTLIRLEEKGFLTSQLGGATTERGGRRKRLFRVTALGSRALQEIQLLRQQLWQLVPPQAVKISGV